MGDDVCRRSSLSPRGSNEIVTVGDVSALERRSPNEALTLDAGVFVLLKHLFQVAISIKFEAKYVYLKYLHYIQKNEVKGFDKFCTNIPFNKI